MIALYAQWVTTSEYAVYNENLLIPLHIHITFLHQIMTAVLTMLIYDVT